MFRLLPIEWYEIINLLVVFGAPTQLDLPRSKIKKYSTGKTIGFY
jgi:hypothetical protein